HPKSWIVGIRRVRERNGERSNGSRHEALTRGCGSDTIGPFPALPRRLFINIRSQAAERRIVDDFLVELGILAAAVLPRIVYKKFALGDAGGAKCVRLNDVRPSFQEPAMDIADHFWLGQREQITII